MENNLKSMSKAWDEFIYSRTNNILDNINDKEYQEGKEKSDKLYDSIKECVTPKLWDLINEYIDTETACYARIIHLVYKQALQDGAEFKFRGNALENISITELLCRGFEAHEDELYTKIKANPEYQEAQATFLKHLDTLKANQAYMSEIEHSATVMEIVAKDIAFDEGFKLAVRIILSSVS